LEGPLAKFFNKRVQNKIQSAFKKSDYSFNGVQTILVIAGKSKEVSEQMGWLRSKMGDLCLI
jgi:hypothetical protein